MKSRVIRSVLVSLCALLAASCTSSEGNGVRNPALRVGDLSLTSDQFTKRLEDAQLLSPDNPFAKKRQGVWDAQFVNTVANQVLLKEAIAEEYKSRKGIKAVKLTEEQAGNARGGLSPEDFAKLPKSVQKSELDLYIQAFSIIEFEASKPITTYCVKHILVKELTLAKSLRAELLGGASFKKLAAENSLDPGSKVQGGDLGCTEPDGYVAPFQKAVTTQKLNALSQPVKTEFGYHLIVVTKKTEKPATDLDATARQTRGGKAFQTAFNARVVAMPASIDASLGSLNPPGPSAGPRFGPVGGPLASATPPFAVNPQG